MINSDYCDNYSVAESPGSMDASLEKLKNLTGKARQQEEKRLRRLIRNREAARRLKKKEWVDRLQNSNERAELLNRELKDRVSVLQRELAAIQGDLIKSGFVNHIQQYSEIMKPE